MITHDTINIKSHIDKDIAKLCQNITICNNRGDDIGEDETE